MVLSAKKFLSSISVSLRYVSLGDGQFNLLLQSVLSVVFPQSLEVGLSRDLSSHLMRIQEVFLFDDLRGQLVEFFPLLLEFSTSFLGGGVNTKHNIGGLIGIIEAVQLFFHVVNVTTMTQPVDLRLLIEEQS